MKKISLAIYRETAPRVLEKIQHLGVVEFVPATNNQDAPGRAGSEYNLLLSRLHQAIAFLSNYDSSSKGFAAFARGSRVFVKEEECERIMKSFDYSGALDRVFPLHDKLNEIRQLISRTLGEKEMLSGWADFRMPLSGNLTTRRTKTILARYARKTDKKSNVQADELVRTCAEDFMPAEFLFLSDGRLALTVLKEYQERARAILARAGYEIVELPDRRGMPEEEVILLGEQLNRLKDKKEAMEKEAGVLAGEYVSKLKILFDVFSWKKDLSEAVYAADATRDVLLFEGWCPENRLATVRGEIRKITPYFDIQEIVPAAGEEPPVEIENSSIARPFESVTRLYGFPGYLDLDPTPFLAVFFFVFFGLSLSDAGYGLALIAFSIFLITYLKVENTVRLFAYLLLLGGISSVAVGLLFGGYLGISSAYLPAWLAKLQLFDPIGNPLPIFYMALGLGVIQVMFGIALKIVRDTKNGELKKGILDQGPWLALFLAAILYGASYTGYIQNNSQFFLWMVYVSAAGVLISGGRSGETLFAKMRLSALSLYQSIGYFSDILSYSRLLALGLATTALAFAVNLIAGIVSDSVPYVGILLAGIVLIVGHIFNLAVNTLGAFIHSARLQFVEFFGKFIFGTGRQFRPFGRKLSYVTIERGINN